MSDEKPGQITVHVCGGKQADVCKDGKPHDMTGLAVFKDGASVCCIKCGVTAMSLDMMRLP